MINKKLTWIPGSGGEIRETSKRLGYFTVTRGSKIKIQKESLEKVLENIDADLAVVGVSNSDKRAILNSRVNYIGLERQENIFKYGATLVVLSGYGEGVPHVVNDAILTGLDILIEKKEYLRYGFNKLNFEVERIGEWLLLRNTQKNSFYFNGFLINKYEECIDNLIKTI